MDFGITINDNTLDVTMLRIRTPIFKEDDYDNTILTENKNIYINIFIFVAIIIFTFGFIYLFFCI